ncbi:DtxR family Mn-dependent transcriptional regulator [Pedobacter cryoconitis]|uniref:metal-dependent transcriptional regulator n=1 Tax=Pedobacter cryoconitis TaxID=188932 RepID=UPI001613048C|nr:metal-dependent transcriptional regulator [Pedobacter cryoconitis]MBB6272226.1 DtxR family Mn-dependent transcriptional regulator [Pedobacter cryoconitis]
MHSFTEENYLKVIYHLSQADTGTVQTNAIANGMNTKAASVTDMLKKLSDKKLIDYIKYQGVTLTEKGRAAAIKVIRKHRLWEVFLVDKLKFRWDEVHDIAEELEHINSPVLVERLDGFLGFPKRDPHGDPIPDKDGNFEPSENVHLHHMTSGKSGIIIGVSEHSSPFLIHLEKLGLTIGVPLSVLEITDYDGSVELMVGTQRINVSRKVAEHILIKL